MISRLRDLDWPARCGTRTTIGRGRCDWRETRPVCTRCGYSLVGLPEKHECPECGEAYERAELARTWRRWLFYGKSEQTKNEKKKD